MFVLMSFYRFQMRDDLFFDIQSAGKFIKIYYEKYQIIFKSYMIELIAVKFGILVLCIGIFVTDSLFR